MLDDAGGIGRIDGMGLGGSGEERYLVSIADCVGWVLRILVDMPTVYLVGQVGDHTHLCSCEVRDIRGLV